MPTLIYSLFNFTFISNLFLSQFLQSPRCFASVKTSQIEICACDNWYAPKWLVYNTISLFYHHSHMLQMQSWHLHIRIENLYKQDFCFLLLNVLLLHLVQLCHFLRYENPYIMLSLPHLLMRNYIFYLFILYEV